MLKRVLEWLESVPATVIGGVCLLVSLGLSLAGIPLPLWADPAWVAAVLSGLPLVYSAIRKAVCNRGIRRISSALLISIAMAASIAIGDVFAAGEIAFIMAVGELLEEKTTGRAKRGLRQLIGLAPTQGRRLVEGREETVPAAHIRVGDILRILPGETIPVDGTILQGETSVDQSVMTGESLPVDKGAGDPVYCGTINRFGAIDITATKVGADSSLQRMIRLVQEAEEKQAPIQRIADSWASWLVPVALLLAVVAGLLRQDIVVAVTVLVVFCPCALVLATPTAIMAAIGQATKHGVLIKSGEALEKMGRVDTIAFDKTGTLTEGRLAVTDVCPLADGVDAPALLALTAAAESRSEHPLGRAILAAAQAEELPPEEVTNFRMQAGKGVYARVGAVDLYCGSEAFIREQGIPLSPAGVAKLEALRQQGKATVLTATPEQVLGVVALADRVKPEAADMLRRLEAIGTEAILLTGDNRQTAAWFAGQVGLSRVQAELLPEQKVACIAALQREGKTVCMIGDGVNDAPALKTADVGVAMGTMGSDIAIDAADIALMGDDIAKIPYLKRLSNATVATVRWGILLSLLINFVAILLSFLGLLNPTTGALVHNAGSCLVVLFAALLYDRKLDTAPKKKG